MLLFLHKFLYRQYTDFRERYAFEYIEMVVV